jgi:hypothetical protein
VAPLAVGASTPKATANAVASSEIDFSLTRLTVR